MAWSIKRLFGRGKPKEEPAPEVPPPPVRPTAGAPAPEPRKPGRLRRLFGRGKRKEGPAPAAPPTAPPPPSAPPEAPPAAESGGVTEAPPEEAEREYPPFLHVSADGEWVISDTTWEGTMSGTLHGADVKVFIDAMEGDGGPDYETAIPMIADSYGIPGELINVAASTVYAVHY